MDNDRTGIIEQEQGILKKDGIYFFNPTAFAQEHLFYPHWGAEYTCAIPYRVDRSEQDAFNAFILFYIVKGNLGFSYRGKQFTATAGDIVLLDCNYPNHYWAESEVQFRWLHFTGNSSQAYCDMLYERQQAHFPNHPDLGIHFYSLLHGIKTGESNAHSDSILLHSILGGLASSEASKRLLNPAVLSAKKYMDAHFAEILTVADISAAINLSQYHFSRLFRAETGLSIHGYLLEIRLNHAKKMLSESDASVEQVAQQCGFSSTSHFIRAFKNTMHITPARLRGLFR